MGSYNLFIFMIREHRRFWKLHANPLWFSSVRAPASGATNGSSRWMAWSSSIHADARRNVETTSQLTLKGSWRHGRFSLAAMPWFDGTSVGLLLWGHVKFFVWRHAYDAASLGWGFLVNNNNNNGVLVLFEPTI